jgi:cell division septation protein DedD
MNVRYELRARFHMLAACAATALCLSCSQVAPCNVSPVEIEELKEDLTLIDKDLAGVQDRVKRLSDDLAAKQADLDAKKPKPDELRRRLELLKQGSGRTEKKPAEAKPAEKKPAEAKPVEKKPAEAKPVEKKPAEAKPVEKKPAEAKPDTTKKESS